MIQSVRYSVWSAETAFSLHRTITGRETRRVFLPIATLRYFTLSVHVYHTPGETCKDWRVKLVSRK
jgi:hypothetical protein